MIKNLRKTAMLLAAAALLIFTGCNNLVSGVISGDGLNGNGAGLLVSVSNVDDYARLLAPVKDDGSGNMVYSEGVISKGSKIIVPQGMAMMIIDNGQIVEFTDTPGDYSWDSSTEPSVFSGKLGKSIVDSIKTIGKRITYGGQSAKDQRVYYVNIKTLPAITYGSQQPETIVDPVYGSVEVTYNGEFNIKVDDPVILVNTMLGANPKDTLTFDDIFSTEGRNILKGKFAQKISEAINEVMSVNNISFNRIQGQRSAIADKMNTLLNEDWHEKYGIVVDREVTININASEEARAQIREIDKVRGMANAESERVGIMSDAYSKNLQGSMAAAAGEAMLHAADNQNGAMGGFVGMGMANAGTQMAAGMINNLPGAQQTSSSNRFCPNCGAAASDTAKFCTQCGQQL